MDLLQKNPFTTIKANDLNDVEINEQWVDSHGGFYDLFLPNNKVSQYILGGKGSGKTHLMRYFSYSSQMIRNSNAIVKGIASDRYFAIYFQASGLNGERFERLPFEVSKKNSLFEYSFELWCAGLIIQALIDIQEKDIIIKDELPFCNAVLSLFSSKPNFEVVNLTNLKAMFRQLSNKIDYAINNVYFSSSFDVEILVKRGELIFGIPEILSETIESMRDVTFLYLIDELENISVEQQKYLNTLLREKRLPCSFRLGARGYGIKTFETFGAGEENREGHEFEIIRLDDILTESDSYEEFAIDLIINRLEKAGFIFKTQKSQTVFDGDLASKKQFLQNFFETPDISKFSDFSVKHDVLITSRISALKNKIQGRGISAESAEIISNNLSFSSAPLIEAANIHIFAQYWDVSGGRTKDELIDESVNISKMASDYFSSPSTDSPIAKKFSYYKSNYLASVLRAKSQNNMEQYLGIQELLQVTKGFPRHILIVLRNIYRTEVFAGNVPFSSTTKISLKSQRLALLETAKWFHDECGKEGVLGENVTNSLERLCELLRIEMYADKPVECSASSFTVDETELSESVTSLIKWAVLIRVLIKGKSRQDKNSQKLISKYHVNSLLCPMWGLAVGRRGALNFSPDNASSIFLSDKKVNFESLISSYTQSRNLPYFVKEDTKNIVNKDIQIDLGF